MIWSDRPVYVELDPATLRQAQDRADADACSCVVRGARVVQTHRQFWAWVEQKHSARASVRRFERCG